MGNLKEIIKKENWTYLVENYPSRQVIENLSFKECLVLSRNLSEHFIFHNHWDAKLQLYIPELVEEIKKSFNDEWDSNWKHEAYLGYIYEWVESDLEKAFDAYQRAVVKARIPPVELLMNLAIYWRYPGIYKVKMDEKRAIDIFEKVANVKPYREAASGLVQLYNEIGDKERASYWKSILKASEESNITDQRLYLDFLDEYERDCA